MLSSSGYWIALALLSAVCATAAVVGVAKRAPLRVSLAWFVPAALLGVLGYLDWAAQPSKETSLASYLVDAVLAPLGAIATAAMFQANQPRLLQWLAAGVASLLIMVVVAIAAFSP